MSQALDWSPDGRYIDVVWGAEAPGAPPKVMTLFDLQLNTTTNISSDPNMGAGLGQIRFSPDSQHIAVVEGGTLNFFDLTGARITSETNPISSQPIWWQNGASIPDPVRLELAPAEVAVYNGGVSGDHTMVVSFALPVTFTSASIVSGAATVADALVTGKNVQVDLTGVTNAQTLSLQLSGVTDTFSAGDVIIPMSVLLGDTTGDGQVTSADGNQTRGQLGQPVTNSNFREDVTVDGRINNSDVQTVRSALGTHLP